VSVNLFDSHIHAVTAVTRFINHTVIGITKFANIAKASAGIMWLAHGDNDVSTAAGGSDARAISSRIK
jgi:hypothetical protein